MINVKVLPLARYVIETHDLEEKIRKEIGWMKNKDFSNLRILESLQWGAKSVVIWIDRRNNETGAEEYCIEAEISSDAYNVDERRVIFNRTSFPLTMEIGWRRDIEAGTMTARKLVDIECFAKRKVKDFNRSATGLITIFTLEEPDEENLIGWQIATDG